ncbi:MAG: AMP-binding protein [Bacteroidales bacterium]|nr:AMP-binding protein [Bacteroidales bacterium]
MESFNQVYADSFKAHWELPALSNYQGVTLYYKDLAKRIAWFHTFFRECGIVPGDKIAICSRNQANWCVSFFSIITYGAVVVPLLHEFKPANIHHLVNHSGTKILFADTGILDNLDFEQMPGLMGIIRINPFEVAASRGTFRDLFLRGEQAFDAAFPRGFTPECIRYYADQPDELAVLNYTSGTSGFSKGVMIPYRSLLGNLALARIAEPQMNEKSEVVAMLPSAHMYGLAFEILYEMSIGAHIHFLTRIPSPKILLNAMAQIRPSIVIAVPLIIEKVYKNNIKPRLDKWWFRCLLNTPLVGKYMKYKIRKQLVDAFGGRFKEVIIGGAAFNKEVEKFLHNIHFPFTVGYGMTECGPIITYSAWDKTKLYSCGQAAVGMQICINSPQPDKIPGEVLLKGPNVFLGYYDNPEATEVSFNREGWFRTGDMGILDKEGFLFLKGRSKCMILGPSGQNIYPEEIECVLNALDYVVESLVIEDQGNLVALIYPDFQRAEREGLAVDAMKAMVEKLVKEAGSSLPSYSKIHHIEFLVDDFERTPKKSIKRYIYQR